MDMEDNTTTCNLTSTNMSMERCGKIMKMQLVTYYIENFIEPCLFLMGLIANIFTLTVLLNMTMHKVMKVLIVTLCITDFFTSAFGFINILMEVLRFQGDIPYGKWSLEIMEVFTTYKLFLMFLGMSSAMIILTSVIRTYSLRNPLKSRTTINTVKVIKLIAVTLVLTIILFLPTFIYAVWKACFDDKKNKTCAEFFSLMPHAEMARLYFSLMCIILGPGTVVANIVCFILLKLAIKKSSKDVTNMQQAANTLLAKQQVQSKKNSRINKLIMDILIFNTVCIIPSCIQVVALIINPRTLLFDKTDLSVAIVDCIAEIFLAILPSYNFWIYLLHNQDFRRKFKQVILRQNVGMPTPGNTPNWTPKTNTPNMTPQNATPNMTPKNTTPVPSKININSTAVPKTASKILQRHSCDLGIIPNNSWPSLISSSTDSTNTIPQRSSSVSLKEKLLMFKTNKPI